MNGSCEQKPRDFLGPERQRASELLEEIDRARGPEDITDDWRMRAETLLVFAAIKIHCQKNEQGCRDDGS